MKKIIIIFNFFIVVQFLSAVNANVDLRPSHIDLSAITSESAVLMTISDYPSNDAKYRLYNGSYQYNCWDSVTEAYITSNTYANGPNIPGTPSTSTTFWILFQRGGNNSTVASYRDRLNPYSSNYQTTALPAATSISSPFELTGSVSAAGGYDLSQKYVVLGWDAVSDGSLICAASTALTTGDYTLVCQGGVLIKRVEFRTTLNTVITSEINASGWSSTTNIGDTPLPVTLSSFTASYSKNAAVLNWVTQSETDNLGFNLFRSENEHGYPNGAYLSLNSTLIEGMGTTSTPTYYSFTDEYPVIEGHTYWYWLQSVSTTNKLELFGPVSLEIPVAGQLPTMTILSSNYPNPFNPETTIEFNVKENETGILTIFNLRGERILKESFEAGNHQYHWNAEGLASGIYFYKLSSPTTNISKKMILMK